MERERANVPSVVSDVQGVFDVAEPHEGQREVPRHLAGGRGPLESLHELAKAQHAAGRYFLYEHPWSAWWWMLRAGQVVVQLNGVLAVEGHQCAYNQKSVDLDGCTRLVKKPTGWMTNSLVETVCQRDALD